MNKIRNIKYDDTRIDNTFSTIRELILLDDFNWLRLVCDNRPTTLLSIETLFATNEIFPQGITMFKFELGKFMATLDTFQVSLSLIASLTENKMLRSVLEDFRMSIQNYQIFSANKSYYSAFMEFRKMLEGILWMEYISGNDEIPEFITKMDYQTKLSNIDPSFGEAYSKFNSLFHYREDTPFLNDNIIYNEPDDLYEFLVTIHNVADKYESQIKKFVESFDGYTFKRYIILLEKVERSRSSYKLKNCEIQPHEKGRFDGGQEKLSELIIKFESHKMMTLKYSYELGLRKLAYSLLEEPKYDNITPALVHLSKMYTKALENYIPIITKELLSLKHLLSTYVRVTSKKDATYKKCKNICLELLELEVRNGGDRRIALLRSVIEDMVVNSANDKHTPYMHTSLISDLIKREFKYEIKPMPKKYSHILRDDRVVYSKMWNDSKINKEVSEKQKELKKEFMNYLKNLENWIISMKK